MSKDKLIEAQREYIKLLETELGKLGWIYASRGYMKPDQDAVQKGIELRALIKSEEESNLGE